MKFISIQSRKFSGTGGETAERRGGNGNKKSRFIVQDRNCSGFALSEVSENGKYNPSRKPAMDIAGVFGRTEEAVFAFEENCEDEEEE